MVQFVANAVEVVDSDQYLIAVGLANANGGVYFEALQFLRTWSSTSGM
jgi:hypothetical protein